MRSADELPGGGPYHASRKTRPPRATSLHAPHEAGKILILILILLVLAALFPVADGRAAPRKASDGSNANWEVVPGQGPGTAPLTAACFTPDGAGIVVASQAGITWRDGTSGEALGSLDTKMDHVHHLTFRADGGLLAACGGSPTERGEVELFRWPPGDESPRRIEAGNDVFFQLAWLAEGDGWIAANGDGRLYVLSGEDGAETPRPLAAHSRRVLAVARMGELLISAGVDRSLRVWQADSLEPLRTLNNHTGTVRDLAVRPATEGSLGMLASAGADSTVRLWQPRIGRLVRFARLPSAPLAIDWLPDGSRLLAACEDGRIRIIHPETVEIEATIDGIAGWAYTLVVAPGGESLLVGGAGGVLRRLAIPPHRGAQE